MSYAGDIVFRRVDGKVLEEPLRHRSDLHEGLALWVPSPSGRFYDATVHWDPGMGFYWKAGDILGWLAFGEDDRRCWVCTGASRLTINS